MTDARQPTTGPLTPFTFVVDEYAQRAFLRAVQDCHLRYVLPRNNRPPLVHPGLLLDRSNPSRSPALGGCDWLHLREEARFCAPAYLGEPLQSRWHMAGTESYAGRTVTVVTAVVSGPGGRTVLRRTSWGRRTRDPVTTEFDTRLASGPHQVNGPQASGPQATGPQATGASGMERPPGARYHLYGQRKLATADRLGLCLGRAGRPRALAGTPGSGKPAGPTVSATHALAHLCELMVDHFGESWLATGSLSIDLHDPIRAGDRLTPTATVLDVPDETEPRPRCRVYLRLVDHLRNVIADGTAEAGW